MVVDESIPIAEIGVAELEEIYELRHQIEVLEKEKKTEKFNFINLSEKNIKLFCGIDIKTFK